MKKTIGILSASLLATVALAIPALGSGAAQTVRVNEVDGRISLSVRPKAGVVKFVVRNRGGDAHDFWVRGGGKRWKTRVLVPGGAATLTATLKRGVRYSFWCGVSDHAEEGMRGSFVAR
ncbi:MAG TPA: hypothetical protein VHH55_06260 [Gaiellaceae bacterium]|nr:hypothetical protein [Gaiellaceae bacterium]